jgi:prepilin-type N-terminal cleavage/methylation domain-containing protein
MPLYRFAVIGNGFSLLELLVSLAVAAVAMLAVVSVFTTLTQSYTTQSASSSVQQVVRAGIEYMAQNIRMAGLNPKRNDDFQILSATPTRIEFTLDRNLNGVKDAGAAEHMAYSYDAEKNEVDEAKDGGAGDRFIENVLDLTFTYFDELGNDLGGAPDPAEIRTVEIELTAAQAAGRDRAVDRTYSTRVICRNLGL